MVRQRKKTNRSIDKRNYVLDYRSVTSRKNLERQGLSMREGQVLRFLSEGKTTPEIGRILGISMKTVQAYCARIKKKVGAQNATQLMRTAFLLCNGDMPVRFDEWLSGVGGIEIRYFDLQGTLIATQRLHCAVSGPDRRRRRRLIKRGRA
jgi:DNA-binding CsgD family transcriptional regulator